MLSKEIKLKANREFILS